MKLKEKILKGFSLLKKSYEKFPITILSVAFLSILCAINLNNDFISSKILVNITNFIVAFACANFLIETIFNGKQLKNKKKMEIISYLISAIWALIITLSINIESDFLGMTNEIFIYRLARVFYAYIIITIILGIYFNYKKSNETLPKYLASTFVNMFKATLIYGIFAAGIAIVVAIFIYLILNGKSYTLISRLEILLLGLYYFPTLLYAFCKKEELGKFAKVVLKYVFSGLIMAMFVVIYIYIIKIIVLQAIPSNQIFRILATLFIIGMPIWTMAIAFDENKIFDKINRKLPILFIPFIFLQIYSIAVRIQENGITPMRYLGIMLIIFEIVYIISYIKKNEKVGEVIFIGFSIITIISAVVPFINMFYISDMSQYSRFKIYYNNEDLTEEEKDSIYSAYYYLNYSSVEGEKYLNLSIDEEKEIKSFNGDSNLSTEQEYDYIYCKVDIYSMDIDEYSKIYTIAESGYLSDGLEANIDDLKIEITLYDENYNEEEKINVDFTEKLNEYIENESDVTSYFKENNVIQLDENRKIILNYLALRYEVNTGAIYSYTIEGYLLTKK